MVHIYVYGDSLQAWEVKQLVEQVGLIVII